MDSNSSCNEQKSCEKLLEEEHFEKKSVFVDRRERGFLAGLISSSKAVPEN
jgi:hypothetical protein|tara:strand:- start:2558 stop:2710 length:153 start_codon:yes stop_codon:yes gene_type:complete